jgi:CHAT domain-containing protein
MSTWASVAFAQSQNQRDEVAELFDRAAAKHKRELNDLINTRGVPQVSIFQNVSSTNISTILTEAESPYSDDTAVLFYSLERETSLLEENQQLQIWLLNEDGIQAFHQQVMLEKQINEAISKLRKALRLDSLQLPRSPHQRGISVTSNVSQPKIPLDLAVKNLTQILLPDSVAAKLNNVKHLIIVPTSQIGTVPYAILRPFKDGSSLVDKMSISMAPSLFDLARVIPSWNTESAFSSPLIVGNPYFPQSADWSVPSLPGAEQEAYAVAKKMKAIPLIGKEATKAEIISRAGKATLLYFATHGIASSSNPLLGGFLCCLLKNLNRVGGQLKRFKVQNYGQGLLS